MPWVSLHLWRSGILLQALTVSNIIDLGTMTYLLLYGAGLRWPWRQIQPIILSHWQRDPEDCWSPGSSSQIASATVLIAPAAEMIAAVALDEIFNLKGLGSSQSSLFGQLRLWRNWESGMQNCCFLPFYSIKNKTRLNSCLFKEMVHCVAWAVRM